MESRKQIPRTADVRFYRVSQQIETAFETAQKLKSGVCVQICGSGSGSARIRIIWPDPDPHPEFWMPDQADQFPDPRLQNWHLINLFSVEKYCE
jgi:hypothetical protein